MTTMTEDELRKLIDKQMKAHDFDNCYVHMTNSIKILGSVNYAVGKKEVDCFRFSRHLTKAKPGIAENTVLHEIAHGIDVRRRGRSDHGPTWQQICMEIGAEPSAQANKAFNESIYRFHIICESCGKVVARRHRMSRKAMETKWKTSYHTVCGPKAKLKIVDTGQKL